MTQRAPDFVITEEAYAWRKQFCADRERLELPITWQRKPEPPTGHDCSHEGAKAP